MQLIRADSASPVLVQTFKWSEITRASVNTQDKSMKIKVADAEVDLKFCPDLESHM